MITFVIDPEYTCEDCFEELPIAVMEEHLMDLHEYSYAAACRQMTYIIRTAEEA